MHAAKEAPVAKNAPADEPTAKGTPAEAPRPDTGSPRGSEEEHDAQQEGAPVVSTIEDVTHGNTIEDISTSMPSYKYRVPEWNTYDRADFDISDRSKLTSKKNIVEDGKYI